jgi:hypothetical protein
MWLEEKIQRQFAVGSCFTRFHIASVVQAAKKCHPDLHKDPKAAEQFRKCLAAYQILMDRESRRLHALHSQSSASNSAADNTNRCGKLSRHVLLCTVAFTSMQRMLCAEQHKLPLVKFWSDLECQAHAEGQ